MEMTGKDILQFLGYIGSFVLVAIASGQLARLSRKIKLPMITGLILVGIISGPWVFGLLSREAVESLDFLNDVSLAFIALAVGTELFLKDIRDRVKSIFWMTVTQLLFTFFIGAAAFYFLGGLIPFMREMNEVSRVVVAILGGIIFAARSPASAIAIIGEMRARGPFTRTSIGTIVVKDFLVVVVFSLLLTFSRSLAEADNITFWAVALAFLEIVAAFGIGLLFARLLYILFSLTGNITLRTVLILIAGFLIFRFSSWFAQFSGNRFGISFHIEPLAITIFTGFIVTNYSKFRQDLVKIIQDTSPVIYIVFFTLIGAGINIGVLSSIWYIALILFGIRVFALFVSGYFGALLGGDGQKHAVISWMAYVTQAGVGIALISVVAAAFPAWGREFSALMIALVIINLITGPPLFKLALQLTGEGKLRSDSSFISRDQRAVIFGNENQSVALAQRLKENDWDVVIVDCKGDVKQESRENVKLFQVNSFNSDELKKVGTHNADTVICLLSDEENVEICHAIRNNFNVRNIIVRLNDRKNLDLFTRLKVMIMDPATAMLSLLEHYTRAPMATSLLLGMDKGQDTMDIRLSNPSLHGVTLRDLQLPMDVIVLSVSRREQIIISHGYTRLRLGDVVTLVGSSESLEQISLQFRG